MNNKAQKFWIKGLFAVSMGILATSNANASEVTTPRVLNDQEISAAAAIVQNAYPREHFAVQKRQSYALKFENQNGGGETWWVNAIDIHPELTKYGKTAGSFASFLIDNGKIERKISLNKNYEVEEVTAVDFPNFNHDRFKDALMIILARPLAGADRTPVNIPVFLENTGASTPDFRQVSFALNCKNTDTINQIKNCLNEETRQSQQAQKRR